MNNGGHLAFGPDGYLYVAFGDGGAAVDPFGPAQHPLSLLGKMLRIDVAVDQNDERGYRVPADNPFVGVGGVLPEIWSAGFRNPWRWSFDDPRDGGTGDLVLADTGEDSWEEINHEPAGAGGRNYGWPIREGRAQRLTEAVTFPSPLQDPVWQYGHEDGRSVIGGVVYRGSALGPAYAGRYFFADYSANRVWSMVLNGAGAVDHSPELAGAASSPVSFGVDGAGELYIVNYSGSVHRIDGTWANTRPRTGPATGTARPR
jgi:glucose/arabinose dehydrogenase